MNHLREHLYSVTLALLVFVLASCQAGPQVLPGQVLELQPGATIAGVRAALAGAPHTVVLTKDGLTVAAWPIARGWGFACLKGCSDPIGMFTYLTGGRGNWTSPATFTDLVNFLKSNGWTVYTGALAHLEATLSIASQAMIGIMVLPVVPSSLPAPAEVDG